VHAFLFYRLDIIISPIFQGPFTQFQRVKVQQMSSASNREKLEMPVEAEQPRLGSLMSDVENQEVGMDTRSPPTSNLPTRKYSGLTKTITAQDWNGPNDPENPMNWSLWQRIYHTTVPALFSFVVTIGSSIYTSGLSDIMKDFDVSSTVALLGLSLYVLGLGFGPVLAAPISESLGRRSVYMISLPLSALFTLGAGFSQTFASLAICRFFAAFFGSPSLAVGAGTNVDIWAPENRAVSTVLFVLAPFAGPALGPVIGGFAAQAKGWMWTQWPILFLAVAAFVYSLFIKETYKKIILQKRAERLGIPPPPKTGPTGVAALKFLVTVTFFRPVHMIFTEPIVGFFSLYTAFNFSVLYGFFDAFPIVFQGVYGFDLGSYGLVWLSVLVGCLLAVFTVIVVDHLTYRKEYLVATKEGKLVAPEHRLYIAMLGSLGLPIGLFWFALVKYADIFDELRILIVQSPDGLLGGTSTGSARPLRQYPLHGATCVFS